MAPSGNELTIRRAGPDDAPAIADVHARSWQATYRGLVSDEVIDDVVAGQAERAARIGRTLSDPDTPHHFFVAVTDRIVGMADAAPSRDADATPTTGELHAIYLAPEALGRGIGRALHDAALEDLSARGFTELTLWVLRENERARRFYQAAGWSPDGAAKDEEWAGGVLHEVRYRRRASTEPS